MAPRTGGRASPAARSDRSAGGPPGVALERRLPGRPSGASGRCGARWSPAAAGVAGLEVGGVAPPAAWRAVGSWAARSGGGTAGRGRRARGGAGAALDSPACPAVLAPPGGPRPGGGSGRTALSRERREPGPRLRCRDEVPAGGRRAPCGSGMTSPGSSLAPLLLLSLQGE